MADKKEVHFFDNDEHFTLPHPNYSTYRAAFTPQTPRQILGETTPIYMYWKNSPQRIFQYNPNIKLILSLRNPIERAYSHWNMEQKRGNETRSFFEALEYEQNLRKNPSRTQHRIISYIDRGFYTKQITRIRNFFPSEQVLIFKTQDLKQTPESILRKVYDFIGVPEFLSFNYTKPVHRTPYNKPLSEMEKIYLSNIFHEEINKLETLLGWDCSDWLR